jgi:hypothetical protein
MKRSNDITGVLLLCSQLYRQSLIVMNMGSKQTCDADPCCISQKEGDNPWCTRPSKGIANNRLHASVSDSKFHLRDRNSIC